MKRKRPGYYTAEGVPLSVEELVKARPKQIGGYHFTPPEEDKLEQSGYCKQVRGDQVVWFDTKQLKH